MSQVLKKYGLLLLIFAVLLIFVVPYLQLALMAPFGNSTTATYYVSLIAVMIVMLLAVWFNNWLQKSDMSLKL